MALLKAASCHGLSLSGKLDDSTPLSSRFSSQKSFLGYPQGRPFCNRSHVIPLLRSVRASAEAATGGLSHRKESQRCLSTLGASLSSTSPEGDSTARSSEGLVDIDLNLPRRRLQLSFTCDACGARTQRLINPDAYARGTVFVQCAGCEVYHKLVDNLGLIEEYDFREEKESKADGADLNVPE